MSHPFPFEIIYSNRKTLAIQVTADGKVKVRAPKRCPDTAIEKFLKEKEAWILKYINRAKQNPSNDKKPLSASERNRYMKIAREIFTLKTNYYAAIMHVTYDRISIREQKTRWGSCSGQGNLNYNWRLILAPEEVINYIVVHELAHRKEMNHSQAFYAIIKSVLPDYKNPQKWLRENGHTLWTIV